MKKLQHWKHMGTTFYTARQQKGLKEELDCLLLKKLQDILLIKSISNRLLLVTVDCNPKIYILKESLEELANPVNNNESLISELNDQLKYLKEDNKNKTEIIKVLTENIDKHLPPHEEFITISNRKKRNSSAT